MQWRRSDWRCSRLEPLVSTGQRPTGSPSERFVRRSSTPRRTTILITLGARGKRRGHHFSAVQPRHAWTPSWARSQRIRCRGQSLDSSTKILILTRHAEMSYVQRLLLAGANGYVLKQSAAEELVRGIRRVVAGQKYLDPAVTDQTIGITLGTDTARTAGPSLSTREEDVLRFVALGFLTKEIATRLDISIKTVETHKANAMIKVGLKNRIDIVRYAMLQGWLDES